MTYRIGRRNPEIFVANRIIDVAKRNDTLDGRVLNAKSLLRYVMD
jgi:hypothetical protein